jgi:tetratricopeptide (TPR) repeat protein
MSIYLRIGVPGVLLWASLLVASAYAGETAEEIQRLLDAGEAGRAYDLALSRSATEAGDPDFDFSFALAAMQVGHPERAVFALERVLFLFPENDRVRLELARAQFMLGNFPEARTQFELVLTHKPPSNVRERVKLFLAKIREQEAAVRPVYHANAAFKAGYDSNLNAATAEGSIPVPGLGTVFLNPEAQELGGNFAELELSGEALRPISKKKALFGKVAAIVRDYFDVDGGFNDEFDNTRFQLRGGISFLGKRSLIRIPLFYERFDLNRSEFRRLFIAGLDWEKPLTNVDRLTTFGQLGAVRYPDQSFRDVDLGLIGTSWAHRLAKANKQVRLGVYYGNEDPVEDSLAARAVGRTYVGIFGGFQWNITPRQLFFLTYNLQDIEHKDSDVVFGEVRKENFVQLAVGWDWHWRPKWTINIKLSYDNNDSNIELFSYDRTQIYGGVRFDFR